MPLINGEPISSSPRLRPPSASRRATSPSVRSGIRRPSGSKAHILVCFLCLRACGRPWSSGRSRAGLGDSPRTVLQELSSDPEHRRCPAVGRRTGPGAADPVRCPAGEGPGHPAGSPGSDPAGTAQSARGSEQNVVPTLRAKSLKNLDPTPRTAEVGLEGLLSPMARACTVVRRHVSHACPYRHQAKPNRLQSNILRGFSTTLKVHNCRPGLQNQYALRFHDGRNILIIHVLGVTPPLAHYLLQYGANRQWSLPKLVCSGG